MRKPLVGASVSLVLILAVWPGSRTQAQSNVGPEEFDAVAILNNNLGAGAGKIFIRILRWSSDAERMHLVNTLLQKGSDALLEALQESQAVGTIRTPDSLAYDLRYAHQRPDEDGGRQVVLATDRPVSFWEARNQPRISTYPFTVIQMRLGGDGEGRGTLSYAAKITVEDNVIELENFGTAPVMLSHIEAKPIR